MYDIRMEQPIKIQFVGRGVSISGVCILLKEYIKRGVHENDEIKVYIVNKGRIAILTNISS